MNIDQHTKLRDDSNFIEHKDNADMKIASYFTKNFVDRGAIPNVKKTALEQPKILYRPGVGRMSLEGELNQSLLKNVNLLTNLNKIQQLAPRVYNTVPYMGRGGGDTEIDTKLRFTEQSRLNYGRACTHTEVDRFVPQLCNIQQIQNSKNIIQEDTDVNWVRGGAASRLLIRDESYLKRCGYNFDGKSWQKVKK